MYFVYTFTFYYKKGLKMSDLQTTGAKREYLTGEEVHALLNVFNTRYISSYRLRTIILLTVNSGLRVSEIVSLKVSDIDYIKRELFIQNSKRGAFRKIPVDMETLQELKTFIDETNATEYVFTNNTGKQLNRSSLDRSIKTYGKKANIQPTKLHFHALRHTYATTLLNSGMALIDIQTLLGHKSIMTTTIYTHVNNEQLREKRATKLF